jgi:hypothetical protein
MPPRPGPPTDATGKDDRRRYFPRSEFPLQGVGEVAEGLRARLASSSPTSLVRLGDGEGMVLARPDPEDPHLGPQVRFHFGPGISASSLGYLADELEESILGADFLGVREDLVGAALAPGTVSLEPDQFLEEFRRSVSLRSVETDISYRDALRLAHLHWFLSGAGFRPDVRFTSAWIHVRLSEEGHLARMLRSQRRVALISSRPSLARTLRELFDLEVELLPVPDLPSAPSPEISGEDPFPSAYERTLTAIESLEPGRLVFVGAGICGKIYCHRIRAAGGFAVDIGSVCDMWMGVPSRLLVLRWLYQASDVPAGLRLEVQAARFR